MTIAKFHWYLTAGLLLACLVLGGGQGWLGDTACQLGALVLIGFVLWRHLHEPEARLPRIAWLAVVPFVLPLVQLLPLPESLWLMPDARGPLRVDLAGAGVAASHRWSLSPLATERAGVWLLPVAAVFLASLQLDHLERRRLLGLLVAIAAASVVLGIAQLAGGTGSPLRPYAITNPTEAVGLFANRNHFASLLAICLPLVLVALAASVQAHPEDEAGRRFLRIAAGVGLALLLILGIALARSRAGVLLGMLGVLLSLPVVFSLRRARGTRRVLAVAVALGLVLAVQFALFGLLQRLALDPLDDARFRYAEAATVVAGQHAPLGSGLGSFRRAFEAVDPEPGANYVNQAHSDWLQLGFEGGWMGNALAAASVAALLLVGWHVWRRRYDPDDRARAIRRAAWIGTVALATHSLGDYPLRTTALLATLGLLAATLSLIPSREIGPRHAS